ncbi:MAG: hypothetical protein K0Q79_1305 [Flavipsychrobacter sp.]|nr:hypothetical protein [Flavipsychrobacter sp.]
MDTATARYIRSGGEPKKLQEVLSAINGIIKKDSLYFEAWVNKLHVECQLNRFDVGLKTVRAMNRLFPNEADAMLLGGVMEYHTGHKKEASYCFNRLLSLDNTILKGHEKDPNYKGVWINKGMVLILLDRAAEGKAILQKIYDAEKDPYTQSYIGFYIMKSKDEIIADKLPGQ